MIDKVLFIIIAQGVGDHLFQGPKLDRKKGSSMKWLIAHTLLFSVALLPLSFFLLGFDTQTALLYFVVNLALHAAVDIGTGRLKEKYWNKNENAYFTVAAADQLTHISIMLLSYAWFAGIYEF